MLIYTGIGSRETPQDILDLMAQIGYELANGWVLRSGGAPGADSAFEYGCVEANGFKEIYLPWNNFQGKWANPAQGYYLGNKPAEARELAQSFIGHWHNCSNGAKTLHSRNTYQVLGADLDKPADLLICWTPGGRIQGGTATAIRMAHHYNIPVINLAVNGAVDMLIKLSNQLEANQSI